MSWRVQRFAGGTHHIFIFYSTRESIRGVGGGWRGSRRSECFSTMEAASVLGQELHSSTYPSAPPHPSVTESSRAIPSHPGRNQYLPLRRALNKQWRELPPTPTHYKVNEATTFPPTSSNHQQRPAANVSVLKAAVTLHDSLACPPSHAGGGRVDAGVVSMGWLQRQP